MGNFRDMESMHEYVENHLQKSPYHQKQEEEIPDLLHALEFREKQWDANWGDFDEYFVKKGPDAEEETEEQMPEAEEQMPDAEEWYEAPRRYEPYKGGKGKGKKGKGKGKKSDAADLREQVAALANTVRTFIEGSAQNSASTALALPANPDRQIIAGICENMARAENALHTAQNVAHSAAQSFGSEAAKIAASRQDLERVLRQYF